MRNRCFSILLVVLIIVATGRGAVYAGDEEAGDSGINRPIQGSSASAVEKLDELDTRIEILTKLRNIKRLENEIEEMENKGERQVEEIPPGLKEQIKKSVPAAGPEEKKRQPRQNDHEQQEGFEDFVSKARVLSVSGFEQNVKAEIRLPEGGALVVEKGRDYGKFGVAKTVSPDGVVMEKQGKRASIPFSDRFTDSAAADEAERLREIDSAEFSLMQR